MSEQIKRNLNYVKLSCFSLYFVILFVERLLSVILSPNYGGEYALKSGNAFNFIAYSVMTLSLAAGTCLFLRLLIPLGRSLRASEEYLFEGREKEWTIAATVLLFGGMMHTGFTLAGVQFAAYGFLIGAMVVRSVESCLSGEDKFTSIVSLVYLTLFSMTIPVCYISFETLPLRGFFFAAEFLAVFALVPLFGYMFLRFMKAGAVDFSPLPLLVMCLLSGAVIALGWREDLNLFVLIFVALTLVCYLSVGLRARKRLSEVDKESE